MIRRSQSREDLRKNIPDIDQHRYKGLRTKEGMSKAGVAGEPKARERREEMRLEN